MVNALNLETSAFPGGTKARRLRSPRYRPAEFRIGVLDATFEHGATMATGQVVDFSGEGLALSLEDDGSSLFLAGDRLSCLRVHRGDDVFFNGHAIIRNVRELEGRLVLGIAFENSWLDMGKFYELDMRLDLEQRFSRSFCDIDALSEIDPRFKAWVADVGYVLDELHARLSSEERRIRGLDHLTQDAASKETIEVVTGRLRTYMTARIAELNELVGGLDERGHQVYRAYFQHHLLAKFVDESPFFYRCHAKPLGYAGDYEVMNMVYRDHRLGTSLYGQVLSVFGLGITAARAVANRVPLVSGLVADIARERPISRLTSLACGPAREISELLETTALEGSTVTLLDVEPLAIQYCEKVLLSQVRQKERNVQIRFIRESVRQIIRQKRLDAVLDQQDVIVSMGLFDYFGDKLFQQLLLRLYELLRPGGHLIVGNFDHTNDSRFLMEYVMEWYLQYRSADQLRDLASVLPREAGIRVESEPLGVNLFLHITKPGRAQSSPDLAKY